MTQANTAPTRPSDRAGLWTFPEGNAPCPGMDNSQGCAHGLGLRRLVSQMRDFGPDSPLPFATFPLTTYNDA